MGTIDGTIIRGESKKSWFINDFCIFNSGSTVSKQPAAHLSSARDKNCHAPLRRSIFYLLPPSGPRGIAAAVGAENMPPAYFLNAPTVQQALIQYRTRQKPWNFNGFRVFLLCHGLSRSAPEKTNLYGTIRGQFSFLPLLGTKYGTIFRPKTGFTCYPLFALKCSVTAYLE